ncbi:MAG: hypothetical protein JSW65_03975 [Candidatus Bipolaricaulota bacterium]|nr:MAG: hypothetical protein JSW65_03975 [Candidatus Bipolaricaulota bacterium]
MPESSGAERDAHDMLRERFGAPAGALGGLRFVVRRDEIWVTSAPPAELAEVRPPGMRAFRITKAGLKPTSLLLRRIAPHLRRNVVDLSRGELEQLLLGRSLPCTPSDGFVALAYAGDVLGCGRCAGGELRCLLPTSQRKGLLEILAAE